MAFITPILFLFWYKNAISKYSAFATRVDNFFSNCSTKPPFSNSTFAIVIPFPLKQAHHIFSLLHIWSLPGFYPVFSDSPFSLICRTHLLLYPTFKDDRFVSAVHTFIASNPNVQRMINDTFGSLNFYIRNLDPKFDHYYRDYLHGNWVASGVTEMFYPMMTQFAKELGFDFVLWHEPDTFPLRSGWLSRIRDSAFAPDSDFWFIGSQSRRDSALGGRIHGHMNGNSVVRVENKCARKFLKRVYEVYRFLPHDTSIMRYLVLPKNLREAQHVIRRMRYTELIGNFAGAEILHREGLLRKYPEMYLVHGRGYFTTINKVWKIETISNPWAQLD